MFYLLVSSATVGRENKKVEKYSNLSENYHFAPVWIETYGAYGPQSIKLIKQIGKKKQEATDENWHFLKIWFIELCVCMYITDAFMMELIERNQDFSITFTHVENKEVRYGLSREGLHSF